MSPREEEAYVRQGVHVAQRRRCVCAPRGICRSEKKIRMYDDGPVAGKNYGIQRRKPNDAFLCMKYGRKKVSFIALRHH
jgi:hypothetical protein